MSRCCLIAVASHQDGALLPFSSPLCMEHGRTKCMYPRPARARAEGYATKNPSF